MRREFAELLVDNSQSFSEIVQWTDKTNLELMSQDTPALCSQMQKWSVTRKEHCPYCEGGSEPKPTLVLVLLSCICYRVSWIYSLPLDDEGAADPSKSMYPSADCHSYKWIIINCHHCSSQRYLATFFVRWYFSKVLCGSINVGKQKIFNSPNCMFLPKTQMQNNNLMTLDR